MSKEIVDKKSQELAVMNFEDYAGEGTDDFEQDDLSTPFLKVLQKNSPQVDPDNSAYIEGAQAGMFYNTALNTVYKTPTKVVPVAYKRVFLKWKDLDAGGGFLGEVPKDEALALEQDDRGRFVVDADTYVEDTRLHFVLHITEDGVQPCIMSLSSSMIKASKNWNNIAKNLRLTRANGTSFPAPIFSHVYTAESTSEKKDSYSWKGLKVHTPVLIDDAEVFQQAAEFAKIVREGEAVVDHAKHNGQENADDSFDDDGDEF